MNKFRLPFINLQSNNMQRQLNLLFPIIILVIILLLPNCTRHQLLSGEDVGICFETEILPIFISNCSNSGCHNAQDKVRGYDMTYYDGIKKGIRPFNPDRSNFLTIMRAGGDNIMPPSPFPEVSEAQYNLIKEWIKAGAPNTIDCISNNCDTLANISYANDIQPILARSCTGCHNNSSQGGDYNLANYPGVSISVNNGSLIGATEHSNGYSAMPPNSDKIPSCDIKTLKVWIQEGALNN